MSLKSLPLAALVLTTLCLGSATAQEPGWASEVVLPATTQRRIDAMPIHQRPYRPLHFYGNTVRRMRYRGRVLPTRNDLRNTRLHLMRRSYVPAQRYVR